MKEKFVMPEAELVEFGDDAIATSGCVWGTIYHTEGGHSHGYKGCMLVSDDSHQDAEEGWLSPTE